MRDRLIEIIKSTPHGMKTLGDVLDSLYIENVMVMHLLENGVIVPPCKVGDVVYAIQEKNIKELTVQYINIHKNDIEIVGFPKNENKFGYSFGSNKLGKTVFLTREEAEAKLKEGGEG